MLVIRKIMDKAFQEELCGMCDAEYDPELFAFSAAEGHIGEEGVVIDSYVGILQFTMDSAGGYISTLKTVRGVKNDEALMIMTRAAMQYLADIDLPFVYIDEDAAPAYLINQMGFRTDDHGELSIDLMRFYDSPCKYDSFQPDSN